MATDGVMAPVNSMERLIVELNPEFVEAGRLVWVLHRSAAAVAAREDSAVASAVHPVEATVA